MDFRQAGESGLLQHRPRGGNLVQRDHAAQKMIQREHTMGLAAAKGCFELNDGFAVLARNALQSLYQQAGHTFGNVGTGEKFHRVAVFKGTFAT